ncbi:MAG: hypothetical protein DRJ47_01035 [Thermoprotei archaeon]|nr:MAG: hypothetical protein DRJ47_01035 [Thermoprotei archaeon]
MIVRDLMSHQPVTIGKDDAITTAVKTMVQNEVSHLIVTRDDKPIGVVSEKDIISKLATQRLRRVDVSSLHVSSFMTPNPLTIKSEEDAVEAVKQLLFKGIGILPVVDDEGKLVGSFTKEDSLKMLGKVTRVQLGTLMTVNPVTLQVTEKILHARKIMLEKGFSAIPVLEEDKLRGVITDFRVMETLVGFHESVHWRFRRERIQHLLVSDAMERMPPSVGSELTVSEAVSLFIEKGLKVLCIVENSTLTGIVTKSDLLKCLL